MSRWDDLVCGGTGAGVNISAKSKIGGGIAVAQHFINGPDNLAASRVFTEVVNTNDGNGSIVGARGGNFDLIQITATNNSASDQRADIHLELL